MAKATKAATSKAVVATAKNAVATTGKMNFRADSGRGMEGTTAESFAIPFLTILQKGSPQCDEASPKGLFIKEAKVGDIFNTVTKARTPGKTGTLIIPCAYKRVYLRWGANRGGFKGEVSPEVFEKMKNDGAVAELDGRWYVKDGDKPVSKEKSDLIQDHRNHFILGVSDDQTEWFQALISVKSTQVKKSRALMSALDGVKMDDGEGGKFTPPTFANLVRFVTTPEANDDGTWYGYDFTIEGEVANESLYEAAKRLNEQFAKGAVNVNYNMMDDGDSKPAADTGKF